MTAALPVTMPEINLADPAALTSLPRWVERLASTDRLATRPVRVPAHLAPSAAERLAMKACAARLRAALSPAPENGEALAKAVLAVLSAFPAAADGPTIGAVAHRYRIALEGLPAWAVSCAIRNWCRGEHGGPNETYRFAPTSAWLRKRADALCKIVAGKAAVLEALADSEVEREFSDDHRRAMAVRLKSIGIRTDDAAATGRAAEKNAA